jgi:hypothetical protein
MHTNTRAHGHKAGAHLASSGRASLLRRRAGELEQDNQSRAGDRRRRAGDGVGDGPSRAHTGQGRVPPGHTRGGTAWTSRTGSRDPGRTDPACPVSLSSKTVEPAGQTRRAPTRRHPKPTPSWLVSARIQRREPTPTLVTTRARTRTRRQAGRQAGRRDGVPWR